MKKKYTFQTRVTLFDIFFANLFNIGLNTRQLDFHICFCILAVAICFNRRHKENRTHTYMDLKKGQNVLTAILDNCRYSSLILYQNATSCSSLKLSVLLKSRCRSVRVSFLLYATGQNHQNAAYIQQRGYRHHISMREVSMNLWPFSIHHIGLDSRNLLCGNLPIAFMPLLTYSHMQNRPTNALNIQPPGSDLTVQFPFCCRLNCVPPPKKEKDMLIP